MTPRPLRSVPLFALVLAAVPARAVEVRVLAVEGSFVSVPAAAAFGASGAARTFSAASTFAPAPSFAPSFAPAPALAPSAAPSLRAASPAPTITAAAAAVPVAAPSVAAPSAAALSATRAAPSAREEKSESAASGLNAAAKVAGERSSGGREGASDERASADESRAFDGAAVERPADDAVTASAPGAWAALPAATAPDAPARSAAVPAAPGARAGSRAWVWPAAAAFVWTAWTALMTIGHHWGLFAHNWFMSVTMALGSFVAGATSEGSGSISFPVMTLLFHIKPAIARDFALMIQSVGMTTAALVIFARRIPVETRAILFGMLGGFAGMALGTTFVAPLFAPPFVKMFFTSLWAAFALAHWRMDRAKGRAVVERIGAFGARDAVALLAFGVVGGIVSSVVGTGLCMVIFTLLTLGYRVSEKVATPTSVVLMASNALFGFFWKSAFAGGMSPIAWNYWWVCVPIVVIGAPFGARFIAGRSRRFVSRLLYAAIGAQLLAALLIVPQTGPLLALSAATFAAGTAIFSWMKRRGDARAEGRA